MRWILLACLLLAGIASSQIEIVREGYWHCEASDTNHSEQKDAIEACANEALADPGVVTHVRPPTYRIVATAAAQSAYPMAFENSDANVPDPPNDPPVWNNTPTPSFQEGIASSYSLVPGDVSDPDGDTLTITDNGACSAALSTLGVTLDDPNDELDYDGVGGDGTLTGCTLDADDGEAAAVTSPTFSVSVTAASSLVWPDGDCDEGASAYQSVIQTRNNVADPVATGCGWATNNDETGAFALWNQTSQAGDFPIVVEMNNTTDLTSCSNQTVPVVCIFETEGEYDMGGTRLTWDNPYTTIVGSFAPGAVIVKGTNTLLWNIQASYLHFIDFHIHGTRTCITPRSDTVATQPGATLENILFQNMTISGGTDGVADMVGGSKIDFIDTLITRPACDVTLGHAFGSLIGGDGANENATQVAWVGSSYMFTDQRQPFVESANWIIADMLVYGRNALEATQIYGKNTPVTASINILNLWDRAIGLGVPSGDTVFFSNTRELATNSNVYLDGLRSDDCSGDAWNAGCVRDSANQEADVRAMAVVAAALPYGVVQLSGFTSYSDADLHTIMTNNLGACPAQRAALVTTDIAHVLAGTGAITDTWTPVNAGSTSNEFTQVASPMADSGDGYSNFQDQLLDQHESSCLVAAP